MSPEPRSQEEMRMQGGLVMAFLLVASTALGYGASVLDRRRRQRMLQIRNLAPLKRIYDLFYFGHPMTFEYFEDCWTFFGELLHVEPGRLRPSDRLADLIGTHTWLGTLGLSEMYDLLAVIGFHVSAGDEDKSPETACETLDDVMNILWKTDGCLAD
jgi:hypothetical protein